MAGSPLESETIVLIHLLMSGKKAFLPFDFQLIFCTSYAGYHAKAMAIVGIVQLYDNVRGPLLF